MQSHLPSPTPSAQGKPWPANPKNRCIDGETCTDAGGTCHSKPPAGLYQLASGCWYANGVVTRTVPYHSDESDLWPELSPPTTPRKTEPQMADFYGEPNSFNYPRKPANLMNMQQSSFWSPYIKHGVCTLARCSVV